MNRCIHWLKIWEWPEDPHKSANPKFIHCQLNHAFYPKGSPHKNGKVLWL